MTEVMPEVPKVVYHRLRTGKAGEHPDANLLAAFAEQTLSAAERGNMVSHLALCGECREAVSLSIPASETAQTFVSEAAATPAFRNTFSGRRMWFRWNRLGWAGLAAGVLIAVGVLMMQPGKNSSVNEARKDGSLGAIQPAGSLTANKVAPPSSSPAVTAEDRDEAGAPQVASRLDAPKKKMAAASPTRMPLAAPQLKAQEPVADLGHAAEKKDLQAGTAIGGFLSRPSAAGETVEVTSQAPVQTQSDQTADTLAENSAAPVVRAKAARAANAPAAPAKTTDAKREVAGLANESAPMSYTTSQSQVAGANTVQMLQKAQIQPQWAVRGDELQRSLDSGAHWATVFHQGALLCVGAASNHVWAGGRNGELFHSADSGTTWTQVHPSAAGQALTDDVTHVEVSSPNQILLSTTKGESWSTNDAGKTWAKK